MKILKKWSIILLLLSSSVAYAQTNMNGFVLQGAIGNLNAPARVLLFYNEQDKVFSDSCELKNGIFKFNGKVDVPVKAVLFLDRSGDNSFYAGNVDRLDIILENSTIRLAADDSLKLSKITGSGLNDEFKQYKSFVDVPLERTVNTMYDAADDATKNSEDFQNKIGKLVQQVHQQQFAKDIAYVARYPDSRVSLLALTDMTKNADFLQAHLQTIDSTYKLLTPALRQYKEGMRIALKIIDARNFSPGSVAPDFTLNDANGRPVSLSSFRNRYVLLDFWASWCVPCRAENPNLVRIYNKYKDQNFTILGVSLDGQDAKAAWLKAIQTDGLVWTQVSDLKFWNNEAAKKYKIKSIPQNYLIDPSGKIIATNLHGDELERKLKEVLSGPATMPATRKKE